MDTKKLFKGNSIDPVFAYIVRNDTIYIHPGWISQHGSFISDKDNRRRVMDPDEGVVRNGMVWLRKRNDYQALSLLLEFYEKRANDLEKQIKAIDENIAMIKRNSLMQ